MTIYEIYRKENLSVRAYNTCKYGDIDTIEDLIEYYLENKSFMKLRNCGQKSNEELIRLYTKYKNIHLGIDISYPVKLENKFKKVISELSRNQRDVINSFIQVNTNSLSIRSQNAIKNLLKNNLKIRKFGEDIIYNDNFEIERVRNVGPNSATELEMYIDLIKEFVIEVSKFKCDKYLISLKNKFLIHKTFSILNIPIEILESESIFQLSSFLINENALFDVNQTKILIKAFKIYQNSPVISLDEIAPEVNLTRERVRQIRKNIFEDLFDKLLFIRSFNDDLLQKYSIDYNQLCIEINNSQLDNINRQNNTNFTKEFVTYLIFVYWSNEYEIVGNSEDVLQPKFFNARDRHNWSNFYLVKKELVAEFDFVALLDDISERQNDRIGESYKFSFKSYLSKFLTHDNLEILSSILEVAEKIINQELEIYIDLDDNLTFERNSLKNGFEYSYEALQQLGKPSTVSEITKKIIELHPNYETDDSKIRATLKRANGFVPIGRKSIFGLKIWESEFENFKGGTIRQITEEYLNEFDEPKHISGIAEFVLKFRPNTYERSILDNLKADESGLFLFYKNSTVGLSRKKYDTNIFTPLSLLTNRNVKTWEERFSLLTEFIKSENRIPYSSGCSNEEKQLYRWYNLQKVKISKGKLDDKKVKYIYSITNQFNSSKEGRTSNIISNYKDLEEFIFNKRRLPSANKVGEKKLYAFFYRQRKLFSAKEMDETEELLFTEIGNTLQNLNDENKRN